MQQAKGSENKHSATSIVKTTQSNYSTNLTLQCSIYLTFYVLLDTDNPHRFDNGGAILATRSLQYLLMLQIWHTLPLQAQIFLTMNVGTEPC